MTEKKKKPRQAVALDIVPVWRRLTPELEAEIGAFWKQHHAIGDDAEIARRASEVVCLGRDAEGRICGVCTAVVKVLPRLLQPMYYFRMFLAKTVRGQGYVLVFHNQAKAILQDYNARLPQAEGLGLLLELESTFLSAHYKQAYVREADSVFIGYSPRGLQLRVSYFEGARLLPPAAPVDQA